MRVLPLRSFRRSTRFNQYYSTLAQGYTKLIPHSPILLFRHLTSLKMMMMMIWQLSFGWIDHLFYTSADCRVLNNEREPVNDCMNEWRDPSNFVGKKEGKGENEKDSIVFDSYLSCYYSLENHCLFKPMAYNFELPKCANKTWVSIFYCMLQSVGNVCSVCSSSLIMAMEWFIITEMSFPSIS